MAKLVRENIIEEGYGAGFSMTGGFGGGYRGGLGGTSRGGFGGANNLGGPNSMYTYEVKPLNHTLEQKPTDSLEQVETISIGSKIVGCPISSNATPDNKKKIAGIVRKIVNADNGAIKYYIIQDEATQTYVKIDPLTANLITHEPIEYYYDATDSLPSRRKEKIRAYNKTGKIVRESLI